MHRGIHALTRFEVKLISQPYPGSFLYFTSETKTLCPTVGVQPSGRGVVPTVTGISGRGVVSTATGISGLGCLTVTGISGLGCLTATGISGHGGSNCQQLLDSESGVGCLLDPYRGPPCGGQQYRAFLNATTLRAKSVSGSSSSEPEAIPLPFRLPDLRSASVASLSRPPPGCPKFTTIRCFLSRCGRCGGCCGAGGGGGGGGGGAGGGPPGLSGSAGRTRLNGG